MWGYGLGICSISYMCFGGENDIEFNLYDIFIEV